MSTEIRRHIEEGADGSTQLFQAPTEYLENSLWVFEVTSGGSTSTVDPTDVGGGFYQLTPAPAVGSKLYITYDVNVDDSSSENGLTPWEHNNLNTLLDTIKIQQEALNAMEEALLSRVTKDDFNAWATVIEQEVKDLKSAL